MPPADAEKLLIESEAMKANDKPSKPLKPARSQAELLAVRQRWITIIIQSIALVIALLTCLRVFGIL
jgi:hypothetical protein